MAASKKKKYKKKSNSSNKWNSYFKIDCCWPQNQKQKIVLSLVFILYFPAFSKTLKYFLLFFCFQKPKQKSNSWKQVKNLQKALKGQLQKSSALKSRTASNELKRASKRIHRDLYPSVAALAAVFIAATWIMWLGYSMLRYKLNECCDIDLQRQNKIKTWEENVTMNVLFTGEKNEILF